METYLMISDMTGKQYPHLLTENGILIEGITVTVDDYRLDEIQNILETKETMRIKNRIFRTKKIIEISIVQHAKGAQ